MVTFQTERDQNGSKIFNEKMFETFWLDEDLIPLYSYFFTRVVAKQDMW